MNFVYITTNLVNGKQYVGDHTTENLNDKYLGSGIYLKNAIKKYGVKNFKIEILEILETKQEAFNAQEKWIKEYETLTPNGYNISPTGGHQNGKLSEETKEKISKNHAKHWLGKNMSEESKQKNRDKHLGKKLSKEHKQKIGKALKDKKRPEEAVKKIFYYQKKNN